MNLKFKKKRKKKVSVKFIHANYFFPLSLFFSLDRVVSNPRNSKIFRHSKLFRLLDRGIEISSIPNSLSQRSETDRPFVSRNLSTFQSRLIHETRTFCIPGLTFNVDYTTTFDLIYPLSLLLLNELCISHKLIELSTLSKSSLYLSLSLSKICFTVKSKMIKQQILQPWIS